MKRSIIETILGAVVLIVAGVFLFFAYTSTDIRVTRGYALTANFNAIDGLTVGSDVRLGGVKIGAVSELSIDQSVYQAVVTMMIQQRIKLPADTQVLISSDGLLGGKYVRLEPGPRTTTLAAGGPLRQASTIASTSAAAPAKTASTDPSRRFRIQPRIFKRAASPAAQPRNQTPWTRPSITTRVALSVTCNRPIRIPG